MIITKKLNKILSKEWGHVEKKVVKNVGKSVGKNVVKKEESVCLVVAVKKLTKLKKAVITAQ